MSSKADKDYKGIKVSAYNEDSEPERLERLIKVVNFVIQSIKPRYIYSLHDHKGMLTVTWDNKIPTTHYKNLIEEAWSQVGEIPDNVEHILHGRVSEPDFQYYDMIDGRWKFLGE